jgi:hypothetical protein
MQDRLDNFFMIISTVVMFEYYLTCDDNRLVIMQSFLFD